MAESIFTNQTPTAPDVLEGGGINTAVTFVPAVSGTVTGVRFFAAATVAGTYTGMLYQPTTDDDPQGTGAGTLLGSKVRPTAPTGGAWNVITFDTPIPVSAGVPYRAVVHSSAGRYVSTPGVFASVGITNGNLTAPANGVNSGGLGSLWQGTFRTGALGYPSEAFGGGNYFVDVVFEPTAVPNEGEADFPLIIMLSATGETPGAEGGAAGFGIGFTLAASGEAAGPRLIAPSEGSRLVYAIGTALSRPLLARPMTAVTIYAAETGPALADIRAMGGSTVPGSVLVTDQWSQLPLFRMPESIDTVYGQVADGPRWPIYAREDDRIDRAEAQIASLENQVAAIVVPDVTDLEADVTALQSDVLGIEGDLGDLTIDVDGLSVAVDYVEGDVTALETLTGTQGAAITALQASVAPVAGLAAGYVMLPAATGVNDTAAINAVLSANAGKRIVGRPGSVYRTSAPLVVGSGTTLDMTGCTVNLLTGSNCNSLQNAAIGTVRRVKDAVTTAASTTITSATAAFVAGDVGKTIVVHGAAAGGNTLTTTISAVTNGTTAVLAVAASVSISNTYAAIGNRDAGIAVIGGTWTRASGNGAAAAGWDRHALRFRHIDGFRLLNVNVTTLDGKYAVTVGDMNNVEIQGIDFASASDGVHIQGPMSRVLVDRIRGATVDDTVAITPRDWTAYDDVFGNVTDVTVTDIMSVSTAACNFKVLGGSPATFARRVSARGIYGSANNNAMILGDDTAQANTTGGLVDELSVEQVHCSVPNGQSIAYINGVNMRRMRLQGITFDNSAAAAPVIRFAPATTATFQSVIIRDVMAQALNANQVIKIDGTATVSRMIAAGITVASTVGAAAIVWITGAVTDLTLRDVTASLTGSSYVLQMESGVAATCTRLSIADVHVSGSGGGLISAPTNTQTLPRAEISNVLLNATAWLVDLNTATELHLSNVTTTSPTAGIMNVRANAVLVIRGAGLNLAAGGSGVNVTAGGTVTSRTFALECDVTKLLVTAANSTAYNTNAGLACGVGPVVSNGTLWKHLYTGATT